MKQRTALVTLKINWDPSHHEHPERWDWRTILDMPPSCEDPMVVEAPDADIVDADNQIAVDSLRERLTGHALAGLMANPCSNDMNPHGIAKTTVAIANATLAELRWKVEGDREHKCRECGAMFKPTYGEYSRCPGCLAAQHARGEKATGTE